VVLVVHQRARRHGKRHVLGHAHLGAGQWINVDAGKVHGAVHDGDQAIHGAEFAHDRGDLVGHADNAGGLGVFPAVQSMALGRKTDAACRNDSGPGFAHKPACQHGDAVGVAGVGVNDVDALAGADARQPPRAVQVEFAAQGQGNAGDLRAAVVVAPSTSWGSLAIAASSFSFKSPGVDTSACWSARYMVPSRDMRPSIMSGCWAKYSLMSTGCPRLIGTDSVRRNG